MNKKILGVPLGVVIFLVLFALLIELPIISTVNKYYVGFANIQYRLEKVEQALISPTPTASPKPFPSVSPKPAKKTSMPEASSSATPTDFFITQ